jgi:hypothetical protein
MKEFLRSLLVLATVPNFPALPAVAAVRVPKR